MEKLTSILVIVGRTEADHVLLEKAVTIARSAGAQLFLYSCDPVLARAVAHAQDREEAERSWRNVQSEHMSYLRWLRDTVAPKNVQISVAAECFSSLHHGIVNRIRELRPDLVMKVPSGVHPLRRLTFGPSDWHLVHECPVTLMLVRQHPWKSPPAFAALVDVSDEETERVAKMIVHTSEHFSLGCHGVLDVIYSEDQLEAAERDRRSKALERLAREYRIEAKHLHVLTGDPRLTLPQFTAQRHYDALVLGALTHHKGLARLAGNLTNNLVERLDSDFILVKAEGQAPADSQRPNVAWQALFGD